MGRIFLEAAWAGAGRVEGYVPRGTFPERRGGRQCRGVAGGLRQGFFYRAVEAFFYGRAFVFSLCAGVQ